MNEIRLTCGYYTVRLYRDAANVLIPVRDVKNILGVRKHKLRKLIADIPYNHLVRIDQSSRVYINCVTLEGLHMIIESYSYKYPKAAGLLKKWIKSHIDC